jgi:hypothetical protein
VAFAATASLAKKASTLVPVPDHDGEACNAIIAGDRILKQRQYVVMPTWRRGSISISSCRTAGREVETNPV